jgi:hypothetical protein
MTSTESICISQVQELLAHNGYDVAETAPGVLRVRDVQSGVSFQTALEGNVLYMTVNLMSLPTADITSEVMHKMLSGKNGISTSGFRLYDGADGKTLVTLNNFCKLQDMGPEDHDDILSLASYLLADVVAARDLLQPALAAAT